MQLPEEQCEVAHGTGDGRAPSEAGSERSDAFVCSGRTAGGCSEASSGSGQAAGWEVIVPMPSREDLGIAHLDRPVARVRLASGQPDPAWTHRVTPGPDRRQRHLFAVWDMAVHAQGVQADFRISFPCPLLIRGGPNLPHGQELVSMFAYRLVSLHWRVQTGVWKIGDEGTLTTAGIVNLSVVTGWDKRKPECMDVAWLAMRVHMGRQRKGGADFIDVEGGQEAPAARKRKAQSPPPPKGTISPPQGPVYGNGRGGMWMSGWSSSSSSSSTRRGRSARSARRLPTATSRPAYLRPTKTRGPPRRSRRPSATTKIASPPG